MADLFIQPALHRGRVPAHALNVLTAFSVTISITVVILIYVLSHRWHKETCVLLLFTIKVGGSVGIPITIPLDMVSAIGSAALGHSPLAASIPGDRLCQWSSTCTTFHCGSQLCLRMVGERCVEKMKNGAHRI